MTITEFLEARIAEDEEENKSLAELEDDDARGWAIAYAQRVLAECAAKRAIIESHRNISSALDKESRLEAKLMLDGMKEGMRMAIVALTYPYVDHPEHNKEWAL